MGAFFTIYSLNKLLEPGQNTVLPNAPPVFCMGPSIIDVNSEGKGGGIPNRQSESILSKYNESTGDPGGVLKSENEATSIMDCHYVE